MSGKFKTTWFWASKGKFDSERGFFVKEKTSKVSQRYVDMDEFAQNLQNAYEELDGQGYDVVNVIPVTTGTKELSTQPGGITVGEIGFSITTGAVVVGKRRDPESD